MIIKGRYQPQNTIYKKQDLIPAWLKRIRAEEALLKRAQNKTKVKTAQKIAG